VLILCFCAQKSKKKLNKLQVVLRNLVKIKNILFEVDLQAKNLNKHLFNKK
jgi:hypothetical protein